MADGVVNERTGGRTEGRTEGRRDGRTDGRCEVVVLSLLSSCRLLVFSSCRLVVLSSCRLVVLSSSPLVVLSSSPLVVSAALLSCLLSFGVRPRGKLEVARRSFVFGLLQSSFVVSRQSLVTSRKAQVASRSTVVLCSSSFVLRCCCLALTSIRVFSLFASFCLSPRCCGRWLACSPHVYVAVDYTASFEYVTSRGESIAADFRTN